MTLPIGHLLLLNRKSQSSGLQKFTRVLKGPILSVATVSPQDYSERAAAAPSIMFSKDSISSRKERGTSEKTQKTKNFFFFLLCLLLFAQHHSLLSFNILYLIGQNMTILKPITQKGNQIAPMGLDQFLVQPLRWGTLPPGNTSVLLPLTCTWPWPSFQPQMGFRAGFIWHGPVQLHRAPH